MKETVFILKARNEPKEHTFFACRGLGFLTAGSFSMTFLVHFCFESAWPLGLAQSLMAPSVSPDRQIACYANSYMCVCTEKRSQGTNERRIKQIVRTT